MRNQRGQATVQLAAGERFALDRVRLAENDTRARGALESALRRGLFATTFGPGYYRGFVDRADDLVAVEVREPEVLVALAPPTIAAGDARAQPRVRPGSRSAPPPRWRDGRDLRRPGLGRSHDFENTYLERQSLEADSATSGT